VLGARVLDAHVTAGDRARDQIGTALDAIRQHLVSRAAQPLHALHDDLVVPAPRMSAPIAIRKLAKVDDLGSRRAFSMTVLTVASVAAIIKFSCQWRSRYRATSRGAFRREARPGLSRPRW